MDADKISLPSFVSRLVGVLSRRGAIGHLKTTLGVRADQDGSIIDYLEHNAATMPDAAAIKYRGRTISWREYDEMTNQVAHYLRQRGLKKGDAVAVNLENRPELLVLVMGTLKIGGIAGMINTGQTGDVLAHSLNLVQPKLLFLGEEILDNMASVQSLLDDQHKGNLIFVADDSDTKAPKGYLDLDAELKDCATSRLTDPPAMKLGDPCYYIFTSGTTGMPKASITSHIKIKRTATHFGATAMSLTAKDTFYCPLPFYHSNALTIANGSSLVTGATLAVSRKFSASRFWDECIEMEATASTYIGELLRYLLVQEPSAKERQHKVVKLIGNGLRPDIWMDVKERFGIKRIHEFYGASEGTTGFVNLFNYDKTCGWAPGQGRDWQVVEYDVTADEPIYGSDGFMKPLGTGETGLLVTRVSERWPFDGYTDEQESERKLFRNVFEEGDVWFNTGDLMTVQKFGHALFADRVGDTFRWQGENVATTEVEGAAIKFDSIEDAVVYGVSAPGRDGRVGMMFATPRDGQALDLTGLAAHLRAELPAYAVPRFLRIGSGTSLTGTFKYQKATLKTEAYDLGAVGADEVYLLAPGEDAWQQMTPELQKQVDDGDIRL